MKNRIWLPTAPDIWEGATFLRKWGLIGILIGIGAGLGAIALIWCINLVSQATLVTRSR